MSNFLSEFTRTVGEALEAEDRVIATALRGRGKVGGLLLWPSERYYQTVAWRAALSLCDARLEVERQDLILEAAPYSARIEMKKWLGVGLDLANLRNGILADIKKLQQCATLDTAFMLFSSNDRSVIDEQLHILETRVFTETLQPIWANGPLTYCFHTATVWQPEAEFWIAVWPVKIGPMFS